MKRYLNAFLNIQTNVCSRSSTCREIIIPCRPDGVERCISQITQWKSRRLTADRFKRSAKLVNYRKRVCTATSTHVLAWTWNRRDKTFQPIIRRSRSSFVERRETISIAFGSEPKGNFHAVTRDREVVECFWCHWQCDPRGKRDRAEN